LAISERTSLKSSEGRRPRQAAHADNRGRIQRQGDNYYFEHANRNKRGIVLDMKKPKGMEVFLKLIDSADVFLNNMSIGAPLRLGIGPDELLARNPRLIYAQASGWGRKGPIANNLSFRLHRHRAVRPDDGGGRRQNPPSMILPGLGDELGGLMCAWGVSLALFAREKTGKGQVVDTSLMGSVVAMLGHLISGTAMLKQEFRDSSGQTWAMPCTTITAARTADGSPSRISIRTGGGLKSAAPRPGKSG